MTKKAPIIGTIFSSDSSNDSDVTVNHHVRTSARTSASDSGTKKIHKVNLTSADERVVRGSKPRAPIIVEKSNAPDGYIQYDKSRLASLAINTYIQYMKTNGKSISGKYFKGYDQIGNQITIGFFKHNKRNYSEKLSNISNIYIKSINGGANPLSNTINLTKDQWKTIERDTILSYEKNDHEWVYRVKFNAFIKAADGSTRMSMTSERGYGYVVNPANIATMHKHITSNDKLTLYILDKLRKLETRVKELEKKAKH